MAPMRRIEHHAGRRKPVLSALVAGVIFGLLIAGIRFSRTSHSTYRPASDEVVSEEGLHLQASASYPFS